MRTLAVFLVLTTTSFAELPSSELHRLAAYCAYAVTAVEVDVSPDTPKPGGVCRECNGAKKVGDGVVMFTCGHCNGTGIEPVSSSAPKEEPPSGKAVVVPSGGSSWNWQGRNNVSASTKRSHLIQEHGMSKSQVDQMSNQEMTALHNLLHNEEVRKASPKQATAKSSSSCPGGNCPTSNSTTTYRRYSVFRRR